MRVRPQPSTCATSRTVSSIRCGFSRAGFMTPLSCVQTDGVASGEGLGDADHRSVTCRLVPEHVVETGPADPGGGTELGHRPTARDDGSTETHRLKPSRRGTPQGTVRWLCLTVRPSSEGVERLYSHALLNPIVAAGSDIRLHKLAGTGFTGAPRQAGASTSLTLRTVTPRCEWDSAAELIGDHALQPELHRGSVASLPGAGGTVRT